MNNQIGMEATLSLDGSIDSLCRCLMFEWKGLALLVLEILAVSCYYSETATFVVLESLRQWSHSRGEGAFVGLLRALEIEDIQIRADVMTLINRMIMGCYDVLTRSIVRDSFIRLQISQRLKESIKQAELELSSFENQSNKQKTSSKQKVLIDEDIEHLNSVFGPHTSEDLSAAHNLRQSIVEDKDKTINNDKMISSAKSHPINPTKGYMRGFCYAAKNAERANAAVVDMIGIGIKKTKRRYYELHGDSFRWFNDKDMLGSFSISAIIDVRNFSSDIHLTKLVPNNCFEIETRERVYALGCDNIQDKENWLIALNVARDKFIFNSSEFKAHSKGLQLDVQSAKEHLLQLKKQSDLYHSIAAADSIKVLSEEGVDRGSLETVIRYLQLRSTSTNSEERLHLLLCELLPISPSDVTVWDQIVEFVKSVNMSNVGSITLSHSVTYSKDDQSNVAHHNLSRLALQIISLENEIKLLKQGTLAVSKETSDVLSVDSTFTTKSTNTTSNSNIDSTIKTKSISTTIDTTNDSTVTSKNVRTSNDSTNITSNPTNISSNPTNISSNSSSSSANSSSSPSNTSIQSKVSIDVKLSISDATSVVSNVDKSNENDEKLERFRKMLRMFPEAVVRQKMSLEGFSEVDINKLIAGGSTESQCSSNQKASSDIASTEVVDNKYLKYDKMLKMLPEGAVRQKMLTDGITQSEIDKYFNKSSSAAGDIAPIVNMDTTSINNKKLKAVYWTKLSNDEIDRTLWKSVANVSNVFEERDLNELDDWFSNSSPKKLSNSHSQSSETIASDLSTDTPKSPVVNTAKVSLFDPKRTQNTLIALGRIKISFNTLVEIIKELSESSLSLALTESLLDLTPSEDDLVILRNYHGSSNSLDRVSDFYYHMSTIPKVSARLQCHSIVYRWMDESNELILKFNVFVSAYREINESKDSLLSLMSLILLTGNYLNGGSNRGQAKGVGFDILSKLSTVKGKASADVLTGQISLVEYVAYIAYKKSNNSITAAEKLTNYSSNWTAVWATKELLLIDLLREYNKLLEDIAVINRELQQLDKSSEWFNGLSARVTPFLTSTSNRLKDLELIRQTTIDNLFDLAIQFGESNALSIANSNISMNQKEQSITNFLTILTTFTSNYSNAINKLKERKKQLDRQQSKQKQSQQNVNDDTNRISRPRVKLSEDIFANYHNMKLATTEDLISEFLSN
eukprot:CAMPEP_0196762732 /NCGR_PEP_ID=MMETSP1095-20130614/2671_1 /TAXON_ID=96789 ORGANISM="Chromulina nebulosa, Strain UTEXLB2642" /NCGR_SAMPLE_ID=MMETSP1095 /ASSEMBLY_ACC=CAM_ASM_000446 /LENGTH=1196 /DNA_ID=CAMNT_0042114415 /DNA_START=419 /DNA_END=4009 /DNA_ORIENTATION=-